MNRTETYTLITGLAIGLFMLFWEGMAMAQGNGQLVRMAQIQIDPAQLSQYTAALSEEIEASVRIEPGVLTLYAVSEKEQPTLITIFETYASTDAYKAHLETPHFKKYKTSTAAMVKSLKLVQTDPILLRSKLGKAAVQDKNLVVQLAKLQIDGPQLEHYKTILKEGVETAIRVEPGVLTFYAVADKEQPSQLTILEVYTNADAYKTHLETPHFKKYKTSTMEMVKSLELVKAVPILLGAK